MSKGKRYETEGKLNYQKVFAVIIAIVVIVMFVLIIKNVLARRSELNRDYEYFAVFSANKWGVINQDGETVINQSYQELIVIPDQTKDVFLCTYDINEETGEYKTKAINSKNEEILTGYDKIEAIDNIDKNENVWYEDNILRVQKDGKYGLIDLNGKELLPTEYDEIIGLNGIENSILIKKDDKYGLVNDTGSVIIEPNYKEIKNLGETYREGYITIDENDKYGVISATKMKLLDNKYDNIEQVYLSDYYLVTENGERKVINSSGETVLNSGFEQISSKTEDGFIYVSQGLYGEINTTGEVQIEPTYQDLKQVKNGVYIAKNNDRYGIIDNEGNTMIPFDYTLITYNKDAKLFIADDANYNTTIINENYESKITGILSEINTTKSYIRMRVDDEYKYYDLSCQEKTNIEVLEDNTLFLSKKDGKYGFVDKKGNVVVDYIYDDATEQNEYGFVAVKKDGKWGAIDKDGKVVVEPIYNLENNLKIDFIGRWHLGEDINMNYYCEK